MLTVTQLAHHWPLSDSSTIDLWMCSTSCSPCSPLPTGTNPTRNQYDHEPLHSCLSNDNQAWADGSPSHLCVGGRWRGGGQCEADIHTLFFCGGPPRVFLIAEIARCASGAGSLICKYEEFCENTTYRIRLSVKPQTYLRGTSHCMEVRRRMPAYLWACVLFGMCCET